jgi:hypothetical protein
MAEISKSSSLCQFLSFFEVIWIDGDVNLGFDHIITSGSKDLNNALCYIVLPSEMEDI